MDYKKIYNQIIERAKNRELECIVEKHHIIPKCLGGNNKKENLIKLTLREHYLCHMLFCEIYPKNIKLKQALWLMSIGRGNKEHKLKTNSRLYERLKSEHAEYLKTQKPNLGNKHSIKTKEKMSKSHLGTKKSKETREKMKKSALGRKKSEEWKENLSKSCSKSFGKPVIQYDMDGNFIREWGTGKEAANNYPHIKYTTLNNCTNQNKKNPNKNHHTGGYIWKYKKY